MILKKKNLETNRFISIGHVDTEDNDLLKLLTKHTDKNTVYYYLFDKILIWKSKKVAVKNDICDENRSLNE